MRKITKMLVAVILVIIAASFTTTEEPLSGYKAGDMATDFKLKNIDGRMVQLADYKNAKGFIVIFTCNHCPYAQAYEDRIVALEKKYASKGYPVIAINPNDVVRQPEDSYEKMQERAKEKGFTFAYLYDETQQVAKTYGATRTPHVYVLKKTAKGNEVVYVGAIDDNYEDAAAVKEKYVEAAVDASLANRAVDKKITKAIGCTIKWKK
jgi:peroxiredoxin